jgi:hypothetical protein
LRVHEQNGTSPPPLSLDINFLQEKPRSYIYDKVFPTETGSLEVLSSLETEFFVLLSSEDAEEGVVQFGIGCDLLIQS